MNMFGWLQRLITKPEPAAAPVSRPAPVSQPVAEAAPAPVLTPRPAAANSPEVSFDQRDMVDGAYFRWLFDTEGDAALDTSAAENKILAALAEIINSQQSGAAMVRRLPGLIPQLLQSLRSDNFSGAQLSRLISNDVVLLAAVIRLANNLFRGTGTSINSVEHAVILIGQEGLRQIITTVAFRPIIDINSGHHTRLMAPRIWDHSERSAVANRMMAESMGVDPFEGFLAGLVQNVGLIVSLRVMDQLAKNDKTLGSEMFSARLTRDARSLTTSIGTEWSFPDSVNQAIREQAGVKRGMSISPLGRMLTLSDYLAKVRILSEHGRINANDPAIWEGLPPLAQTCYRLLDAVVEHEPAPAAS
jgi:HD-like signal output (HDOD) protein